MLCDGIHVPVSRPLSVSVRQRASVTPIWSTKTHYWAKSESVLLMRGHSSHLTGYRPIERNSHKSFEFSTRKTCFTKRLGISDEPGGLRHHSVVRWHSEKTVDNPRPM